MRLPLNDLKKAKSPGYKKLIKQLAVIALILLFPAIIFDYLLQNYEQNKRKLSDIAEISDAKIAMARLQREISLENVINEAFSKFQQRAAKISQQNGDPAKHVEALEKIFFKTFPASTELRWFRKDFTIIQPPSGEKITKKTGWEKFLKVTVSPDLASKIEVKIADGLVKTEMSDFLSCSFFSRVLITTVEILYQRRRILLRVLKLKAANKLYPEYLLIKLPIDRAKEGWLEERALKKISTGDFQAGLFRISEQTATEDSLISGNLLHGFSAEFWKGNSYHFFPNHLYYFSQQLGNPDVFLCIEKKRANPEISNFVSFRTMIRTLPYLPFFLTLLLSLSGKIDFYHLNLSLRTRFKIATTCLTVIPIALMAILGMLYSAQVNMELEQEMINSLDNSIDRFNDSLTNQTAQLETFLQTGLAKKLSSENPDQKTAEKALNLLKNSGCHLAAILKPDGKIYGASSLKESLERARTAFFLGFIKVPLANENFDIEKLETATHSPISGKIQVYKDKKFKFDFFDRLNSIEMGSTVANLFSTFIRDSDNNITGCICAGFDSNIMQQCFLRNSLELNKDNKTQVFLKSLSPDGTFYTPKSKKVNELLNLTALTGETFVKKIRANKNDYLVYSRMLKDVPTAAVAVLQIKQDAKTIQSIFTAILLIIGGLALINSKTIFKLFEKVFLLPVILLTESVEAIRNGDFNVCLSTDGKDELARLKTSFNSMVRGLKEKSEMKNFLSEDLVIQARDKQEIKVEKTSAAVMFCGIRNFSQIEKRTTPEEAFEIMNLFLSVCDEEVKKAGGTTDKFIGETAMAFFRENQQANEVEMALTAALNIKIALEQKLLELPPEKTFNFGVGVAFGKLIAGHIGSLNKRLDYTVIGDPVNLAARLEKLAGRGGKPQILSTDESYARWSGKFRANPQGSIQVKGKQIPINVVEILGKQNDAI